MRLACELHGLVAVRGAPDDDETPVLVQDRADQLRETIVVFAITRATASVAPRERVRSGLTMRR